MKKASDIEQQQQKVEEEEEEHVLPSPFFEGTGTHLVAHHRIF